MDWIHMYIYMVKHRATGSYSCRIETMKPDTLALSVGITLYHLLTSFRVRLSKMFSILTVGERYPMWPKPQCTEQLTKYPINSCSCTGSKWDLAMFNAKPASTNSTLIIPNNLTASARGWAPPRPSSIEDKHFRPKAQAVRIQQSS